MTFLDYAWSALLQISKKNHEDVKLLLRDNLKFPVLGYDNVGFVVCLVKPHKISDGLMRYQDMILDHNNLFHRKMLWHLFKASIFHLSVHVTTSDFKIYDAWTKNKHTNLAVFAASLAEDAAANAYFKEKWPNLLPDIAYANTVSHLRMRSWSNTTNKAFQIIASTLSQYHMGTTKSKVSQDLLEDIQTIISHINELENSACQKFRELDKIQEEKNSPFNISEVLANSKLDTATRIYGILDKYGEIAEVPFLLHTESYGQKSGLFTNYLPTEDQINSTLPTAYRNLGLEIPENIDADRIERMVESEIYQVFSAWEARENKQGRILESYKPLLENTNFRSIEFPSEDYVEYLRNRALLSGQIRRIMHKLRLLKNVTGEDFKHESGLVDLQEAIQVVASKSRRTDIFVREELQSSEQAWAILVDGSHSLNLATGTVRGVALCLGDVAKNIIIDQHAWGIFAFNNRFYIIKDFSESYTALSQARIGGLKHSGMTYLPDGIHLATSMLRRRTEQSKVLVVVSDFFPSGYKDIEEKLKENVKKAERSGVGVIGIGVKSRAVKNFFRFNCEVDTPYDLMKKFTKIFIQYSSTR